MACGGRSPPTKKICLHHFHLVTCMFSDLRKPPEIGECRPNTKFLITSYYCDKLDSFNVITFEDREDDLYWMNEQILNIVRETELRLGRIPRTHEVVLAPNKNEYCRAVVLEVVDGVQAEVYFFDVGGFATVEIDKLKPVNVTLTKFPILGHHVILEGFNISSQQIMMDQFQKQMEAFSRREIAIEDVDDSPVSLKHPKIKDLVPQRIVNIFYQLDEKKMSLRDIFQGMIMWDTSGYNSKLPDDDSETETEIAERVTSTLTLSEDGKQELMKVEFKEYLPKHRAHPELHLDLSIPDPAPPDKLEHVIYDYDDEDIYC